MTPRRHTGDCGRRRASTRRPSRLSAALHFAGDLEASHSVPHSPSSKRGRARASRTERHRRRSSLRPTLAAPPRFVALRAAQPRAEARPSLHERGRALPRPNRPSTELRPPLAIVVPAELRPSSSSSLSEVSSAQNRPTVSSIATSPRSPAFSPTRFRGRRCRIPAAPPRTRRHRARTPPAAPAPPRAPLSRAAPPPAAADRHPRRLAPPPPPAGPERPHAAAAQPLRRRAPRCARALARRRGLRPRRVARAAGGPRRRQAVAGEHAAAAAVPGRLAGHGRGVGETEEGGGPGR